MTAYPTTSLNSLAIRNRRLERRHRDCLVFAFLPEHAQKYRGRWPAVRVPVEVHHVVKIAGPRAFSERAQFFSEGFLVGVAIGPDSALRAVRFSRVAPLHLAVRIIFTQSTFGRLIENIEFRRRNGQVRCETECKGIVYSVGIGPLQPKSLLFQVRRWWSIRRVPRCCAGSKYRRFIVKQQRAGLPSSPHVCRANY